MKRLLLALVCLGLAGCATGPRIDDTYRSAGHNSRVQFLVIHFTSTDFASSLKILLTDKVSSHYLVRDDPPTIFRLVDEGRRAFHAGVSSWRGSTQLNASSIGIEIVNRGNRYGDWEPYSDAQMDLVMELVRDIVKRHEILPERVMGHSDIAPQRKVDPGPKFPWKRLADEGLIPWPKAQTVAERLPAYEAALPDVAWFQQRLARHGFEVPRHGELDQATQNVLRAFQMKYRPALHEGVPDAQTAALLDALVNP